MNRHTHVFVSLTMHLSSIKLGLFIDRWGWKATGHVFTTFSPQNSADWDQEVERRFEFQPPTFPAHQPQVLLPLGTGARSGHLTFALKYTKLTELILPSIAWLYKVTLIMEDAKLNWQLEFRLTLSHIQTRHRSSQLSYFLLWTLPLQPGTVYSMFYLQGCFC